MRGPSTCTPTAAPVTFPSAMERRTSAGTLAPAVTTVSQSVALAGVAAWFSRRETVPTMVTICERAFDGNSDRTLPTTPPPALMS